jgi:RNA polymerase sigma factor (TIGR02999 family)
MAMFGRGVRIAAETASRIARHFPRSSVSIRKYAAIAPRAWAVNAITQVLHAMDQGDPHAAEELLPLVYEELRLLAAQKLASEKPGQSLQATALVHEAYVRLVGSDADQHWNGRGHFFAAAAEAMRRILIESARRKKADKRIGQRMRVSLDCVEAATIAPPDEILALDEALEKLLQHDIVAGKLIKLRYYAGLSIEQAAEALGISTATAYRHWAFGRAWLHGQMLADEEKPES